MSKISTSFSCGSHVVYPAHGVGRIKSIETQEVAGHSLKMFVISFEKDRMTLRLPVAKANTSGLRPVSSSKELAKAIHALKGRARVRRNMWSRRAQEYETKINSGNPVSLAEVVRELYRTASQPEQSYSERQVYQNALIRLAGEIAAVESIDPEHAVQKVETILAAA
ncbi:MAG: Transcription factor CarD-like protein [uncultured bacterium]|nr:MAG: Transcription factor CarD-like protein [uncultured bacterium]OFW70069.1 MAG: CarD family transcriptional regulator [Alphaproteobacteria bacterium GWC2_42_16]OFW74569.1 MAG: CarD family transcriptional regulator [Alphaproteobacteria bacterium GWA2_41_27]OFW84841.1 MAG: CarD family transcriptional regulator [Alphaproteobacteria bacterium RIFCSPHIGHO2_12_FULL_42_100]OFW86566.1 MAG: CarD family transcriptional regulator [Alphaproteobacteria bacterium RBG_16_42_14]OFW90963.1 MAG: CarD famil